MKDEKEIKEVVENGVDHSQKVENAADMADDNAKIKDAVTSAESQVPAATETKARGGWWGKSVSRRFMTLALVAALLLNAALTAGVGALLGRHGGKGGHDFKDPQNGRPGYDRFLDNDQNGGGRGFQGGGMMPPGAPQDKAPNNGQGGSQNDTQNNAQDSPQDKTQDNAQNGNA